MKFHKNLVFAFSMCFKVNFQGKTGGRGTEGGEALQVTHALELVEIAVCLVHWPVVSQSYVCVDRFGQIS